MDKDYQQLENIFTKLPEEILHLLFGLIYETDDNASSFKELGLVSLWRQRRVNTFFNEKIRRFTQSYPALTEKKITEVIRFFQPIFESITQQSIGQYYPGKRLASAWKNIHNQQAERAYQVERLKQMANRNLFPILNIDINSNYYLTRSISYMVLIIIINLALKLILDKSDQLLENCANYLLGKEKNATLEILLYSVIWLTYNLLCLYSLKALHEVALFFKDYITKLITSSKHQQELKDAMEGYLAIHPELIEPGKRALAFSKFLAKEAPKSSIRQEFDYNYPPAFLSLFSQHCTPLTLITIDEPAVGLN